ncbi:MAG: hypothetical protein ABJA70_05315 [Chryseolinea sp.]
MKNVAYSLLIMIALAFQPAIAQEYDSDSVYYTKMTRPAAGTLNRKHAAFRDTIKHSTLVNYYFQINSGASIGCSNCDAGWEYTYSLSTIHGVTVGRKLRLGGGTGFDSYTRWRTMPFYANVSYDLFGTKDTHAFFVQAQYGGAIGWYTRTDQDYGLKEDHGGKYMAAQLGYRIKYHGLRISIITGFKRQDVSTYYEYPNEGRTAPNTQTNKREMQRLTLSLGIGWK